MNIMKPEEQLQKDIITEYNLIKNTLPYKSFLYSNRNENNKGGLNGIISGKIYKDMGRIAGIPDLSLLHNNTISFIELKTPKACLTTKGEFTKSKGLSEEQIYIHNLLQEMGYKVEVVYSKETFKMFLRSVAN